MTFGEIGFQKFYLIFKIKIIKSIANIGLHRVGQIFDKFRKIPENVLKKEIWF